MFKPLSLPPLLLTIFLCALANPAEAQSAPLQFRPTEIQLLAPEGEVLQVTRIVGRSASVHSTNHGTVVTTSMAERGVCQTPCRFVLDVPVELRVQNSDFIVSPEGGIQRYQIRPARRGLQVLSRFGAGIATAAVIFGGLVVHQHRDQAIESRGVILGGQLALGLGVPILLASVIGIFRSRSRVRRVDRFEF